MKRVLFLGIIFLLSNQFAFSQVEKDTIIHLNWVSSYKKALIKSKKQKKPILIYFTGSDWCGPCIALDKNLFHTKKFKKFADKNFILHMVDVPRNNDLVSEKVRKMNNKLIKKYNQKAFPTLLMVNHRGKKLGIKTGLYMTEYYYPFFESVLSKY